MDDLAKREAVLAHASKLFDQCPAWLDYFREIYGSEGVIVASFGRRAVEFYESNEGQIVAGQLAALRARDRSTDQSRMITVRVPPAVHEFLKNEATLRNRSLNRLCVDKLLSSLNPKPNSTTRIPFRGSNHLNQPPVGFRSTHVESAG